MDENFFGDPLKFRLFPHRDMSGPISLLHLVSFDLEPDRTTFAAKIVESS